MSKKEKFRKIEEFSFAPEDIDKAADFVSKGLAAFGMTNEHDILRVRLSAEEVILNWKESQGLSSSFNIKISRHFSQVVLSVSCSGMPVDPTVSKDDEFGANPINRSILANLGLSMSWRYDNGVNNVSYTQTIRKKISQPAQIAIAFVSALLLGYLCLMMPGSAIEQFLVENLLNPLFDTFLKLLACVVGPMMLLSAACGIANIGDARQVSTIGRKLMGRFILILSLCSIVSIIPAMLCFPVKIGNPGGESVLKSIIEMILGIIPANIVEPFLNGNTMQILFLGIVIGVVMIILRERLEVFTRFVEQASDVVNYILSFISLLIPAFIFLSVFRIVLEGTLRNNAFGLVKVISLSIVLIAAEMLIELISLKKTGLSFKSIIKKLSSPILISLTTASSTAAYASMKESLSKEFDVDEKYVDFSMPLGIIIFKPQSVIEFIVMALFAANYYNVEISASGIILCLLNAVILSVACPPIPGGGISCYTLMFLSLGIPLEAVSLAVTADIVLDFFITAGDVSDLLVQLTHSNRRMKMRG